MWLAETVETSVYLRWFELRNAVRELEEPILAKTDEIRSPKRAKNRKDHAAAGSWGV
jgi:hypothetical protein